MLRKLTILATAALALAAGSAGATPLGAITEFSSGLNPGANPAQIQAGPDGNLWFSDRAGAVGRITTAGAITEYSSGLNPGASDQSIAMGADGNMWFSDNGTTRAIGMIDPTTHAISEFSGGLNVGSLPLGIAGGPDGALWFNDNGTTKAIGRIDPATHAISEFSSGMNAGANLGRITVGPDGNIWFGDKGTTPSIGTINPTTHVITQYSAGLNAGSLPGGIWTGSDGNIWFTDQGAIRAIGRAGAGAPAASVAAPSVTGSGGVGVAKACGGDAWSTWAGQQPSHNAYGFDGYQWLLDGSPIAGATHPSYTPTPGDVGHQLSCMVTVTYPLLVVTVSATSAAVLVKGATEQLTDLGAAVTGVGPGRSLAAKVAAIEGYVATNDTVNACATLGAFISEVDAQTGKKISTAQAASLITQARDIETALAC
jgi:streptogramin lyase